MKFSAWGSPSGFPPAALLSASSAACRYFQHAERASEAFNAFLLHKNFKQQMWTDSMYETRQLPGIGPLISGLWTQQGLHPAGRHTCKLCSNYPSSRCM